MVPQLVLVENRRSRGHSPLTIYRVSVTAKALPTKAALLFCAPAGPVGLPLPGRSAPTETAAFSEPYCLIVSFTRYWIIWLPLAPLAGRKC